MTRKLLSGYLIAVCYLVAAGCEPNDTVNNQPNTKSDGIYSLKRTRLPNR